MSFNEKYGDAAFCDTLKWQEKCSGSEWETICCTSLLQRLLCRMRLGLHGNAVKSISCPFWHSWHLHPEALSEFCNFKFSVQWTFYRTNWSTCSSQQPCMLDTGQFHLMLSFLSHIDKIFSLHVAIQRPSMTFGTPPLGWLYSQPVRSGKIVINFWVETGWSKMVRKGCIASACSNCLWLWLSCTEYITDYTIELPEIGHDVWIVWNSIRD